VGRELWVGGGRITRSIPKDGYSEKKKRRTNLGPKNMPTGGVGGGVVCCGADLLWSVGKK